jgi:hypothetical protein
VVDPILLTARPYDRRGWSAEGVRRPRAAVVALVL